MDQIAISAVRILGGKSILYFKKLTRGRVLLY